MIATVNRQVLLTLRPTGIPESRHFEIVESAPSAPGANQVLVRNLYLSVEPGMRAWVSAVKNYSEPVPIGGVMRSFAVGRVEASRHPDYREGDLVTGLFGWRTMRRWKLRRSNARSPIQTFRLQQRWVCSVSTG
jgi:NADPH-dependent curcumin reductase